LIRLGEGYFRAQQITSTNHFKRSRCNEFYLAKPFFPSLMDCPLLPPTLVSYKHSDFMSVAQAVHPRKRKRSSQEASDADDTTLISSKRQRANDSTRQARHAARDRFWNTLSKVWLTPRALREFDRRNAAQSLEQRNTSDLERWPRKRSCIEISHLPAASLKNLKRIARRGGPNLVDLRGVSQATVCWKAECLHGKLSVSRTITSVLTDHDPSRFQLPRAEAVEQVQQYNQHFL